ncbi:MAG: PAS domain S-box protein [Bacteroidota bacterium]
MMIRILHLEDDPHDALLINDVLTEENIRADIDVILSREDFIDRIENDSFDLIFADYNLPAFDALSALKIMQDKGVEIPFILVSGTIGEEFAIDSLKAGATDYVLKERLPRLIPAMNRALEEQEERKRREKIEGEIKRQGKLFQEIEKIATLGTFEWDIRTGQVYWSSGLFTIFEQDDASFAPAFESYMAMVHPEDRDLVESKIYQTVREGGDYWYAYRIVVPSGEVKVIETRGEVYRNADDQPERLLGICQDITAEVRAKEALQKSEEKYRNLIEKASDAIIILNRELEILEFNQKAQELLEQPEIDMAGLNILDFLDQEELQERPFQAEEIKQGRSIREVRKAYTTSNKVIQLDISAKLMSNGTVQVICRDVTEKQRVQDALQASERMLRMSQEMAKIGSMKVEFPGTIYTWSKQVFDILGIDHQLEPNYEVFMRCVHPEDQEKVADLQERMLKGKESHFSLGFRIITPAGEQKYVVNNIRVDRDEEDKIIAFTSAIQDITEFKRTQDKLRESEQRNRAIVETVPDGMLILNEDGEIEEYVSDLEGFGSFPSPEMLPQPIELCFPTDVASAYLSAIEEVRSGWATAKFDYPLLSHDKKVFFEAKVRAYGENRYLTFISDITDRKKIEDDIRRFNSVLEQRVELRTRELNETNEALKESEEKYRLISENMSDLITRNTLNGEVEYVSPSVEGILGMSVAEATGMNVFGLIHEEDLLYAQEMSSTAVLNEQENITMAYRYRKKDGDYVWLETVLKGIKDKAGQITHIQTASRDISERKKAEETMRDALRKERELNELRNKFVSMASHQFRTPLAVIHSNMQLLEMKISRDEDEKLDRILHRMKTETSRLTELMDDVLILGKVNARRVTWQPERVELKGLIQEIVNNQYLNRPDKRKVDFRISGREYPVYVDPRLIEHALINLLSNAFKYSPNAPNPILSVRFEEEQVKLLIQDFGVGVPASDQANLFSSFYRAGNTQEFPGTGLGLVIAQEFVELNHGNIQFESEEGVGSTFTITLPKTAPTHG